MASADFCIHIVPITQNDAVLSSFPVCLLYFVSHRLGRTLLICAGMFGNRNPTGDFTGNNFILQGIQISPDYFQYPLEG